MHGKGWCEEALGFVLVGNEDTTYSRFYYDIKVNLQRNGVWIEFNWLMIGFNVVLLSTRFNKYSGSRKTAKIFFCQMGDSQFRKQSVPGRLYVHLPRT
jgi:hypothetical protein